MSALGLLKGIYEEIGNLITELFQILDDKDFESICDKLDSIYLTPEGELDPDFRHEYSSISGKIQELIEYEEEGINPYIIQYLIENIDCLYDYAVKKDKKYIKNLFKLKDHIGLEAGRIELVRRLRWEIESSKESVKTQLDELHKQANILDTNLAESQKILFEALRTSNQADDSMKKLEISAKDMEKKIENVHRDSISILGIFASIVLSFTAGIGFTGAILENIDAVSPYRLMATVIALGLILINLVSILLIYIDKIRTVKEEIKFPLFLIILDVFLAVCLVIIFIAYKFSWL